MVECAAELKSKPLVARNKPNMIAPTLTQIGVVITTTSVRLVNSLKQNEEVKALISEVQEVKIYPLPEDRMLPLAPILAEGVSEMPHIMNNITNMSEAQRLKVMARVKSGDLSTQEAVKLTFYAEREIAREAQEEIACILRRDNKLQTLHVDVLLVTKKAGRILQSAVKSATNRAMTSHRNPFASITDNGRPPTMQLGKAEIPRTSLTAVKHIGNGQYGDVYLAS